MDTECLNEMPEWLKKLYETGEWKQFQFYGEKMTVSDPERYSRLRKTYIEEKVPFRKFCCIYEGQLIYISGMFDPETKRVFFVYTGGDSWEGPSISDAFFAVKPDRLDEKYFIDPPQSILSMTLEEAQKRVVE